MATVKDVQAAVVIDGNQRMKERHLPKCFLFWAFLYDFWLQREKHSLIYAAELAGLVRHTGCRKADTLTIPIYCNKRLQIENWQREGAPGGKPRGNQAQAPGCALPVESQEVLRFPSKDVRHHMQSVASQGSSPEPWRQVFWGELVT